MSENIELPELKAPHPGTLTDRERQVLVLAASSVLNKTMAERLGISIKTVEKHRQTMMKKLRLHDVASLTRYAMRYHLVV